MSKPEDHLYCIHLTEAVGAACSRDTQIELILFVYVAAHSILFLMN
jgi:hypothetical protein